MLTKKLIDQLFQVYAAGFADKDRFIAKAKHEFNVPDEQARILWFAWEAAEAKTTVLLGDKIRKTPEFFMGLR